MSDLHSVPEPSLVVRIFLWLDKYLSRVFGGILGTRDEDDTKWL